jgi:hypothetical protein
MVYTFQFLDFSSCSGVPQTNGFVCTSSVNGITIGRQLKIHYCSSVTRQHSKVFTLSIHIPQNC